MADDTTRIINLTEATEISDGMYLVTDASTGTRKLSLQKVLDKVGGNVADDYDATATYDVGDLVVYKGVLYECSSAITTAEAWNPDHWSRINLGDIVADIDGSIEELYEDKANESGEYDDIVAGTAKQLLSSIYTTNDSPYIYRPTPADSDRERVKRIEGLSVGWNQLCNGSSVTVTSGHKYYMKKASVESIGASDGTALTGLTSGTDMVIDLTILFGSTIADHIYTLEQATEGSGVAWVKQYIDLDSYHAYSQPTIKSVEGLTSHDMVGFNQWDEAWEVGSIATQTGQKIVNNNDIRSKNYTKCLPNTAYSGTCSTGNLIVFWYDADYEFIRFDYIKDSSVKVVTSPSNACYFLLRLDNYGNTYNHDICINRSDPTKNGTYEPYEKHSYPLDSTITLRGIPKLVDGQLKADGDWYEPDGKQTVRYGIVDLGSLHWTADTGQPEGYVYHANVNEVPGVFQGYGICPKYLLDRTASYNNIHDKCFAFTNAQAYLILRVRDDAYSTAEDFKTAVTGTKLVYELATPTTETATPYEELQIVNDFGTEEFVTSSLVPVGNVTEYPANLRDKLQHLPDLADGDGYYLIQQVGTQMALVAFHTPKATGLADGTYTLKATVSGGTPTYSWESES